MDTTARFLLLLLLILIQTTVLPVNFAFALLVASILLIKDFEFIGWLVTVAFMVALFGNLNFGIVLIAFAVSLMLLLLMRKIIPENKLTMALIVLVSLPVANISLVLVANILR